MNKLENARKNSGHCCSTATWQKLESGSLWRDNQT
ncbi:unnamed protein product [Amoebophrya sp. A25]|nr:unnamed protein product [Amoebophrya sp. A25]|eukprot:GSA25T00014290001.1